MNSVIVFTGENGRAAVYGEVESIPLPGDVVTLRNARMILRVADVGFFGLAANGPKADTDTRITASVPSTSCTCVQVLECSPKAADAIDGWLSWSG